MYTRPQTTLRRCPPSESPPLARTGYEVGALLLACDEVEQGTGTWNLARLQFWNADSVFDGHFVSELASYSQDWNRSAPTKKSVRTCTSKLLHNLQILFPVSTQFAYFFHFYVAVTILSHRIGHIGSEWFLTYLSKRKWILRIVDQSRQIARRPATWMFWRITVSFRNSSLSTTLGTSRRCRPWRRTGSRWLVILISDYWGSLFVC